jgi:SAF domain
MRSGVELIPQAHKVVLKAIAAGEPVLRYGHVIGQAKKDLPEGAWVREDSLEMPSAPPLEKLELATAPPPLSFRRLSERRRQHRHQEPARHHHYRSVRGPDR